MSNCNGQGSHTHGQGSHRYADTGRDRGGLLALGGCADPYGGKCTIEGFGDIPILNTDGSPIIRANINGHPAAFIVDTGAQLTTINEKMADRLGLIPTGNTSQMEGVDGPFTATLQVAQHFSLGTGQAHDIGFWSMPADFGGRTIDGLPIAGLFGADFLLNYDLVIDRPNRKLGLYVMHNCPSPIPLWHGDAHKVAMDIAPPSFVRGGALERINVTFTLDGVAVHALLDSGANQTMVPIEIAHQAGVTDAMLSRDAQTHARGVGNRSITGWRHRFNSLQIGDFVLHGVLIDVFPDQEDALLGADFLRNHRVWVPRLGNTMYVQARSEIPPDPH